MILRRTVQRLAARAALAAGLGLAGVAAPMTVGAATAADIFWERAVMSAADSRCHLFTPDITAALLGARAQARGAALRAGAGEGSLQDLADRASRKVEAVPCRSPDLAIAAARVRTAFEGWGRIPRMAFPGDVAAWRADRTYSVDGPTWRLAQAGRVGAQGFTFGLAGRRGETARLIAVADFGDGPGPYSARLLVRDRARAPGAYLNVLQISTSGRLPLVSRAPPRSAATVFAATGRAAAERRLLAPGQASAIAFQFPAAAAEAIAGLDPREAVILEFSFMGRSGDIVRTAYVEVGDFAAGQAFLAAAK